MTSINYYFIIEEVEPGVQGLRARYWSDYSGEWWDGFARMACQKINGDQYDYAFVPVRILDYLLAPTEWVMAVGTTGIY